MDIIVISILVDSNHCSILKVNLKANSHFFFFFYTDHEICWKKKKKIKDKCLAPHCLLSLKVPPSTTEWLQSPACIILSAW